MPMTADALPAPGTARSAPDRLLAVLAAFDHDHPALSLTDISRRAGLTLTTAHRLVGALTGWGALERDASGIYHVGLRLWEIAALAPRGLALRQIALPYLEDLYEATHENVQLAVRDGDEVVYIEWLSGRSAVGVHIRVGARWPLHATGVGLALLAYGDPASQEEYCQGELASFTPYTITDGARLRRALAEVRRTGVAVSSRQVTEDALSVAAPVRGADGSVVAAVSVVVPRVGAQVPVLTPAVRVAARGISRALGWQPGEPRRGSAIPGRGTSAVTATS
ncbi:IclR family transcriptional regulator [Streptomyces ipomoeae]|jgi:DNA-binding IclR family transcriptional regulator|uniref:IclR family transcriptional regulator n=1 Tax=Streptomyces ipomoeae TaxID=103232 RepID=A0AAE9AYC2_9ACTN|nr:IclR family transcriptional regulator [Streptomyces ipomoeae]MDX2822881.1 IclR family transcriptional regulator [Streptomyces ipomoeae]MDX2876231.1 IclR family transcriptional regulator [Streptomyces ipomoeae]TQE25687.1 IclR family transcriptional regulator [Streptomyces ipomoeae]TQE28608.1 IclR family transcriptional regulator [Streptomyces ipomoeae]